MTQFILQSKCIGSDGSFCDSIFPHSVCDPQKNECICPEGFVVVENNGHAICTTLLTDLRCRIDKDCIHVDQSLCHPGTGRCICGSDSIYVPALQGCRKAATIEDNSLCLYCQRLRGVCFLEKSSLRRIGAPNPPRQVGCRCPPHPVRHVSGIYHSLSFCQIHLMDHGERCDMKSHICRSKRARCSQTDESDSNSLCKCPPSHVVVFQAQLEYYECYPKLEPNAPLCESCVASGGMCYDNNNDGSGDGCMCPIRSSTVSIPEEKEFTDQKIFCNFDHLKTVCDDRKLSLCYSPHKNPPFEKLKDHLKLGRSVIYLKSVNRSVISDCQLLKANLSPDYCITLEIPNTKCDLVTVFKEGLMSVSGEVSVVIDRHKMNSWNNLRMSFNCTSKYDITKQYITKPATELDTLRRNPFSISLHIISGTQKTRKINTVKDVYLEIIVHKIINEEVMTTESTFQKRILKAYSCSVNGDVRQDHFLSAFLVKEGCPDYSVSLTFINSLVSLSKLKISPKFLTTLLNHRMTYFFIKCTFFICKIPTQTSCRNESRKWEEENCLTSYPIHSYTYFKLELPPNSLYPVKSVLLPTDSHLFTIIVLSLMIIILIIIFSLLGFKRLTLFKRFMMSSSPSHPSSNQFIKVSSDRYFNIINND